MEECPSHEDLSRFLAGESAVAVAPHLRVCPRCRSAADRLSDDPMLRGWADSLAAWSPAAPNEMELSCLVAALCDPGQGANEEATPGLGLPEVPGDLGQFALEAEVGRGGMGVVYRARERTTGRVVALKVLHSDLADGRARQRFVREVRAAARVEHDNVVRLYAASDPDEPVLYFAMEYLAGPSLGARSRSAAGLTPREAARAVAEAADGLAAAHEAGLVHRDVKPDNILFDPATGRVKVGDFGLARLAAETSALTRDGVAAGTPAYLSPEQARGVADVGPLADVYALGVTLYECLAGEPPFRGTPHRIVQQILQDEPRPPRTLNGAIPRDLETICLKAMAKEPARRYASAAELAADLRRWLAGEPIRARPVGRAGRFWRLCRRYPRVAALASALALALTGGVAGVIWQWRRAEANARNYRAASVDAERNYRQARDAVDRFYTRVVLSGTLDRPGLEPARAEVVRGVLDYYREFLRRRGNDPALRADAAEASFRVALMTHNQGDKRDALAAFQYARVQLEAQARERPQDLEGRRKLGQCIDLTGRLLDELGRTSEALEAHRAVCDVYRKLADDEPGNPSRRQLLGHAYGNLANSYSMGGRAEEARHAYGLARAEQEALLRRDPKSLSFRNDLAMTLHNMNMAVEDNGEKLALLNEALALRRAIAAERPEDNYPKRNVAKTLYLLALVENHLGRYAEALPHLDEASAMFRSIIRAQPVDTDHRNSLAQVTSGRAESLLRLGRPADALAAAEEGLELVDGLVRVDPKNLYARDGRRNLRQLAADAHETLGHLDAALSIRRAAVDELRDLVRDFPDRRVFHDALDAETSAMNGLLARLGQSRR